MSTLETNSIGKYSGNNVSIDDKSLIFNLLHSIPWFLIISDVDYQSFGNTAV